MGGGASLCVAGNRGGAGDWRADSAVGINERVNRFFEWIGLKEKLHRNISRRSSPSVICGGHRSGAMIDRPDLIEADILVQRFSSAS
jgi:hypothetical protein